ncbi:MAG: hypothetical protein R3C31_09525 [Hyphomonadaceae bacterium]
MIALAWISAIADPCEYTPLYERPSPTNRYVAEVYQADCGMMDHSLLLFLRDRSALTFSLSNRPPGTLVAVDEDLGPFENVVWGDEGRLTIEYSSDRHGPELRRTEWGGVRIGMLRVSPAEQKKEGATRKSRPGYGACDGA